MIGVRALQALQGAVRRFTGDDGRPLHARLWQAPPLTLAPASESDLVQYPSRHDALVARHGRAAVMDFYEAELWPALGKLDDTPEVAQARGEAALRALETAARIGSPDKAVDWARRVHAVASGGALEADPRADRAHRRRLRKSLGAPLRRAAGALASAGRRTEAGRAWALLDRSGELSGADRVAYTRSLVSAQDASPAALVAYLRYLEKPTADLDATAVWALVEHHTRIDEHTEPHVARQRLPYNHAMVIGGAPGGAASLSAGLGHLRLDQPDHALHFLRIARDRDDAEGAASFHLARALFRLDRFDEAADAFQRAIERTYSRARALAWQALACARAGRWEQAFGIFREVEATPGAEGLSSELFVFWGRACVLTRAFEEAETRFRRALELDPADPRAATGLAVSLARLGRAGEAVASLESALGRVPSGAGRAPLAYLLGRLLQDEGRPEEAVTHYRSAYRAQPRDPHYALALGLMLDDLGDRDALPVLESVAETELAEPEVFRRLTVGYLRVGDVKGGRPWLKRLLQTAGGAAARPLADRDVVSQSGEAFNDGEYGRSAELLLSVVEPLASEPQVIERLARALALSAAQQLRAGVVTAKVWDDVDRARRLALVPETRFLGAFSDLMRGDLTAAGREFGALAALCPEQPGYQVFAALSGFLAGEEGAAERLASCPGVSGESALESLLAFLQSHIAAQRGDYAGAAAKFQAWAASREAVMSLGLPRPDVNELAACCLRLGLGRASRAPALLGKLNEQFGDGYWDIAVVLVKHHDLASRGAAAATSERIVECHAAYQTLLEATTGPDRPSVVTHYGKWLELVILARLERQELGEAMKLFTALDQLATSPREAARRLREHLESKLRRPSHEAAFALLGHEPERARAIWEDLVRQDPGDLVAIHHLACYHSTRAWDDVQAGRFEASLDGWREGLEWYRRLYESEPFWQTLRDKGRKLEHPGHRFDEDAFEAWRAQALRQRVGALLDLIAFLLAEVKDADRATRLAAGVMAIVPRSGLHESVKRWASDELARRRLDPDATSLPDYDVSRARAEQVIDIDPDNVAARRFLLRAASHVGHDRLARRDRNLADLQRLLDAPRRHADWLEPALDRVGEARGDVVQDLCAWLDEVAELQHARGQAEVDGINDVLQQINHGSLMPTSRRSLLHDLKKRLQQNRAAYEASDAAFARSLALQPVNLKAIERGNDHREQYKTIDTLFGKIGEALG